VFFLYLAWRLRKTVVTLAVTGNTISDRVLRRKRMPVFEWHRLTLTGCRLDLRWLSGRGGRRLYVYFMY
jgi:hypothetical protein